MSKPAAAPEQELVLTRVFDVPCEVVFSAWTDPKHLAQWFGPHGFTNPFCKVDLRPGGEWRHVMRGPDGANYPMTAIFREVARPGRLVFMCYVPEKEKSLFEILTTLTFEDQGGKTKLTLRLQVVKSTPEAAAMLAGMEAGWTQSLERLTGYVTKA